jgi:hypothetical protein
MLFVRSGMEARAASLGITIFFDGIAILSSVTQVFQEYKLRPTDKYCTHSRARLVDEFDRLPSRLEENSGCDAIS